MKYFLLLLILIPVVIASNWWVLKHTWNPKEQAPASISSKTAAPSQEDIELRLTLIEDAIDIIEARLHNHIMHQDIYTSGTKIKD